MTELPPPLTDAVRRFVLVCIESVPHLEALLLLRREPATIWPAAVAARRLYITETMADTLLRALSEAGLAERLDAPCSGFRYAPASAELRAIVDGLADAYAHRLVEVTHLIHQRAGRKAHRFADAFKLRKE